MDRGYDYDAYTSFAQVYDLFRDNVPYEDKYLRIRNNKENVMI